MILIRVIALILHYFSELEAAYVIVVEDRPTMSEWGHILSYSTFGQI